MHDDQTTGGELRRQLAAIVAGIVVRGALSLLVQAWKKLREFIAKRKGGEVLEKFEDDDSG